MESCCATSEAEGATDFRCVQCGFPVKTLYIQYSPGNIRLMKCENCKAIADGYIECEIMILILDLILHKPQAYRHVFYNMFIKKTVNFESFLWKSASAYLVLDFYKMWVLSAKEREASMPPSLTSLLPGFGKMLTGVIFGNLVFLSVVFHATRKFLSASTGFYGWKQMLFVILVSSYFKIFLLAMMARGHLEFICGMKDYISWPNFIDRNINAVGTDFPLRSLEPEEAIQNTFLFLNLSIPQAIIVSRSFIICMFTEFS